MENSVRHMRTFRLALLMLVLGSFLMYSAIFRSEANPAHPHGEFRDIVWSTALIVIVATCGYLLFRCVAVLFSQRKKDSTLSDKSSARKKGSGVF